MVTPKPYSWTYNLETLIFEYPPPLRCRLEFEVAEWGNWLVSYEKGRWVLRNQKDFEIQVGKHTTRTESREYRND
jgi:hypothetical protein